MTILTCQIEGQALPHSSRHGNPGLAKAALGRKQKKGQKIAWFVIDDGQVARATGSLRPVLIEAPDRFFNRRERERITRFEHPQLEVGIDG